MIKQIWTIEYTEFTDYGEYEEKRYAEELKNKVVESFCDLCKGTMWVKVIVDKAGE